MSMDDNAARQRFPVAKDAFMIGARRGEDTRSPEIEVLSRISRLLSTPGPWTTQIDEVMQEINKAVGADVALLLMSDEANGALSVRARVSTLATDKPVNEASASDIALRTFTEQELVIENAMVPSNRRAGPESSTAARSAVGIPVRHGGSIAGVLEVRSRQAGCFTEKKTTMLLAIADSVGILIHNAKLREAVDAEQARVDQKDHFITLASQELRSPMATMLGFTALLLRREPGAEERMEWYRIINEEAARLTRVTDELLDVTSIENGSLLVELGFVDLPAVASRLAGNLTPATDRYSIRVESEPDLPVALADESKVSRVLKTLMENAIKHSPEGGEVLVSLSRNQAQGRVVIEVTDQGIAVSSGDTQTLFDMNGSDEQQETTSARSGGLGLYIVKSLVEKMGGEVSVKSRRHQGTTFSFWLPVAREILS